MPSLTITWLVFAVLFLVLELATVTLVSIWFVAGAIAALIASLLGASFGVQIGVFVLVSAVLLIFTMPVVKRLLKKDSVPTNADRVVGKEGIVTEEINETEGSGKIKVMGSVWSARSNDGSIIPEGETVEVTEISGVRTIVKRKENP